MTGQQFTELYAFGVDARVASPYIQIVGRDWPCPSMERPQMRYQSRPATRNATYKGRQYRCLWSGTCKTGKQMAKLSFLDGSKEFWVALELVTLESEADAEERKEYAIARRRYRETGDYYSSGLYDLES